ncbi:acetate kinase [Longispora fulva]|uniref:Acetate kinase n=1 Tax=Longispora fulva TaxID=619741 RepID=A0A8J7KK48_9ACTN|nr:acetate kinase [Longispora fulva]MBG6140940.1 acetate kinase [Longispora fulva]GIG60794.1 acetate kinase [Longispora fulva]
MSRVLVLNVGSSSVKYSVFDGDDRLDTGLTERVTDHAAAIRALAAHFEDPALTAIGHRVVHGGTRFSAPTLIDGTVEAAIRDLIPLAPLHNPANLAGIEVARALRPDLPQVAVFDTAFHRTIPEAAATYAIDAAVAAEHGIRRYGFHGTSHRYVSRRTAALLGWPFAELNTIVLHLGNGASATAVRGGVSVDTSMGLSPLEGLVMGTRPGDLDPAIPGHLHRAGLTPDEVEELLNRRSGLFGLAGISDMRDLLASPAPEAALAFDVYCHRIRKYVGAYHAVLGRLDAIAFTAGVGENSAVVRAAVLAGLEPLGIEIDAALNEVPSRQARIISPAGARIAVCVVPTDEELEIAAQTRSVLTA